MKIFSFLRTSFLCALVATSLVCCTAPMWAAPEQNELSAQPLVQTEITLQSQVNGIWLLGTGQIPISYALVNASDVAVKHLRFDNADAFYIATEVLLKNVKGEIVKTNGVVRTPPMAPKPEDFVLLAAGKTYRFDLSNAAFAYDYEKLKPGFYTLALTVKISEPAAKNSFGVTNSVALEVRDGRDSPADKLTKAKKLQKQWDTWLEDAKRASHLSNISPIFRAESFISIQRQGANGVKFVLDKVDRKENLGDLFTDEVGISSVMSQVSRMSFHFVPVATPENLELTVYRCEELPTVEVYRRVGQERELWLKWWAEKDAKIPVWFRGRYQMWKTAKAGKDPAKTDAAYRKTVDLGIFALPQWMEKLSSDPMESRAIVAAISELSSGEIAPDATPQQVKEWWKENRDKWTKVTLDDVAASAP